MYVAYLKKEIPFLYHSPFSLSCFHPLSCSILWVTRSKFLKRSSLPFSWSPSSLLLHFSLRAANLNVVLHFPFHPLLPLSCSILCVTCSKSDKGAPLHLLCSPSPFLLNRFGCM
jgi:hypothetical protein